MAEETDPVVSVDMNEPDPQEESDPVISAQVDDGREPFAPDLSASNLVQEFEAHPEGRTALEDIGTKVVRDFDVAYDGCSSWREKAAANWLIFSGDLPKKTWPFENCANAHVPILITNALRIVARLSSELFDDWSNVATISAVGSSDEEKKLATMMTIHTNWQLREQIPDFSRQQERGLLMYMVHGDVPCHSYYDTKCRSNRHEILTVDDFVTPYSHVSTMPDYSDVPFRVKVLRYQRHDLQAMRDVWEHVDDVLEGKAPGWDDEPEALLQETVASVFGIESPSEDGFGAYRILWYEGWLELPGERDDRFCQVIVDYNTKQVMKLSVHEKMDWQDAIRYESQMSELDNFREAQRVHGMQLRQVQDIASQVQRANESGALGPLHKHAAAQAINQSIPQPPPPPSWLESPDDPEAAPKRPRMVPIHLFSHAVCIEPLAGNLGLSWGSIAADHNRAANTIISQFIDQATLSNARTVITSENVEFVGGYEIAPGRQNKVTGLTGTDLAQNMLFPDPGQANPQMTELVEMIHGWAQEEAQAPDVLSGNPGKSGETYRGIATRVEQATKQLSWFGKRYAYPFLRQILQNNCYLNSVFLDDDELISVVNGALGFSGQLKISRRMYQQNYKVEVRSDLRFVPDEQAMGEAMQVLQLGQQNPLLQQNQAFQYQALKGVFEAMKRYDLVPLLGPPPPLPSQMAPPAQPPPQVPPQQQQPPKPPGVPGSGGQVAA